MAKIVLTNALVLVNSVDMSNHVQKVQFQDDRDVVDVTSMGDTSKEIVLGLADSQCTVTFFNDYASGQVDSLLWPLHVTNTPFPLEIRPTNAARSVNNPAYFYTGVLLPSYSPITGSVGDAVTTDVVFQNANQAGLQRLTA